MSVIKTSRLKVFELAKGMYRKEVVRGNHLLVTWNWAEPGAEARIHKHDCEQVVYLLRGTLEVTVDSKTETVEAEAAIFIPSGSAHSVRVVGDEPVMSIDIYAPPLKSVQKVPDKE